MRAALKSNWRTWLFALAILAAGIWAYTQIDIAAWHRRAEEWSSGAVIAAVIVLPLVGFPVSLLHAIAGVRFGTAGGLALVAGSVLIQTFIAYALVACFREPIARRLEGLRRRVPPGAHRPMALFTSLLPGVPYTAKIYALPSFGIPLRIALVWAWPLHVVRSTSALVFGERSDRLTATNLVWLSIYAIALMLTCAWAFRRLRAQAGDPPPAASDPTPAG